LNGERERIPFAQKEFREIHGHFSPETRWIPYMALESVEIYVQPLSPSPDAGTSATAGTRIVSKNSSGSSKQRPLLEVPV